MNAKDHSRALKRFRGIRTFKSVQSGQDLILLSLVAGFIGIFGAFLVIFAGLGVLGMIGRPLLRGVNP